MSHRKEEDDLVSPVSPASVVFPIDQPGVPSRASSIDLVRDGSRFRMQEPPQEPVFFQMPRPSAVSRRISPEISPRTSFDNGQRQRQSPPQQHQQQFNQYRSRVDSTAVAQHSESRAPTNLDTYQSQQNQNQYQYEQSAAYGDYKQPAPITRSDSMASTISPNEPPSKWAYMSQDGWFIETASLVFSLLCVVGILVILILINGKRVDEWPVVLTPNTFVSLLSTLSKAALLVPVANSIGQLKWLHFEKGRPRRLVDLEVFDGATRGPAGAMSLLWNSSTRSSLAVIGSVVTILALLADPFSQQALVITSRSGEAPRGTALFSNATVYDSGASVKGQQTTVNPDASMYAAVLSGAFIMTPANLGFVCTTSNCNWPGSYPFLGVRSSCSNVTHLTVENCTTPGSDGQYKCSYQTPDNLTIQTKTFLDKGTLRSTVLNAVSTTQLSSQDAQLARYAVWKRQTDQDSPWEVTECTLSFAAYYYGNISVIKNSLLVKASVVYPLQRSSESDSDNIPGKAQTLWRFTPNMTNSLDDDQTMGFEAGGKVSRGPEEWRQNLQPVEMMIGLGDFSEAREILSREVFTANLEEPQPVDSYDSSARGVARSVLATDDTSMVSRRVARSMTERLRRGGNGTSAATSPFVRGVAMEKAAFYKVSWGFFVYLPSLILIATILLLITVYQVSRHEARERKSAGLDASTNMPRYKHSSVALLLNNVQGYEGSSRVEAAKSTHAGMKTLAKKEWVLKWRDGFVRAGVPET
ncbi:uncharacterized protein PgNI_03352 [Pyricularia grisea]|uniref:Uncharacterized protein n=1 Tax=Pyricularia grisea TaxID=148305 RepID=A0A6P8B886_PYRGI|nr:uncharacterized protein PgNI_03352 [Pyricularia grisea]TLD12065.1 hypothetical protein PgNI_03352 [Pyricularia grisea]